MADAHNHHRVTPEGRLVGFSLCRMTEPAIVALEHLGDRDERCKSCAFRYGTVPNGCLQTGADAMKAVIEDVPFMCHVKRGSICYGWFAARWALKGKTGSAPWDFSPPDAEES